MKKEERPWGEFKVIHKEPGVTIKIITVKPNQRLSLQSHQERDEMWLLLLGRGFSEIFGILEEMKKGIVYIIPREEKHRLTAGEKGIKVLEISFGEFDENDIIRYEDDYGRIDNK
jgi:mannose-6-phosphate isomerase-like protein (cupin superfamily)